MKYKGQAKSYYSMTDFNYTFKQEVMQKYKQIKILRNIKYFLAAFFAVSVIVFFIMSAIFTVAMLVGAFTSLFLTLGFCVSASVTRLERVLQIDLLKSSEYAEYLNRLLATYEDSIREEIKKYNTVQGKYQQLIINSGIADFEIEESIKDCKNRIKELRQYSDKIRYMLQQHVKINSFNKAERQYADFCTEEIVDWFVIFQVIKEE